MSDGGPSGAQATPTPIGRLPGEVAEVVKETPPRTLLPTTSFLLGKTPTPKPSFYSNGSPAMPGGLVKQKSLAAVLLGAGLSQPSPGTSDRPTYQSPLLEMLGVSSNMLNSVPQKPIWNTPTRLPTIDHAEIEDAESVTSYQSLDEVAKLVDTQEGVSSNRHSDAAWEALARKCADFEAALATQVQKATEAEQQCLALSAAVATSECGLAALQKTNEQLEQENRVQNGKICQLEEQCTDALKRTVETKAAESALQRDVSTLRQEKLELGDKISTLQLQYEAAKRQLQDDATIISALQQEMSASTENNLMMSEQVSALQQDIARLAEDKSTLGERLAALQQEVFRLTNANATSGEHLSGLREEISSLNAEKSMFQEQVSALKQEISNLNGDKSKLSEQVTAVQQLYAEAQRQLSDNATLLSGLQEEIFTLREVKAKLDDELSRTHQQRDQANERAVHAEKELCDIQQEVKNLQHENLQMQEMMNPLREQLEIGKAVETDHRLALTELSTWKAKYTALTEEKEARENELNGLLKVATARALPSCVPVIMASIQDLRSAFESLRKEVPHSLNRFRPDNEELRRAFSLLSSERKSLLRELESSRAKSSHLISEIATLKLASDQALHRAATTSDEKSALLVTIDTLRQEIIESDAARDFALAEIKALSAAHAAECQHLREELEAAALFVAEANHRRVESLSILPVQLKQGVEHAEKLLQATTAAALGAVSRSEEKLSQLSEVLRTVRRRKLQQDNETAALRNQVAHYKIALAQKQQYVLQLETSQHELAILQERHRENPAKAAASVYKLQSVWERDMVALDAGLSRNVERLELLQRQVAEAMHQMLLVRSARADRQAYQAANAAAVEGRQIEAEALLVTKELDLLQGAVHNLRIIDIVPTSSTAQARKGRPPTRLDIDSVDNLILHVQPHVSPVKNMRSHSLVEDIHALAEGYRSAVQAGGKATPGFAVSPDIMYSVPPPGASTEISGRARNRSASASRDARKSFSPLDWQRNLRSSSPSPRSPPKATGSQVVLTAANPRAR